jgi:hypothetical protein
VPAAFNDDAIGFLHVRNPFGDTRPITWPASILDDLRQMHFGALAGATTRPVPATSGTICNVFEDHGTRPYAKVREVDAAADACGPMVVTICFQAFFLVAFLGKIQ